MAFRKKFETRSSVNSGLSGACKYAPYFLTVADIVSFARSGFDKDGNQDRPDPLPGAWLGGEFDDLLLPRRHGGGSGATTRFCSTAFVSEERNEPPDIDVDFEHERREEVIQYIYKKYGRDRAGLAATLICYRGRSAIREVAKVFGYSEDRISSLAKMLHWWSRRRRARTT